VLETESTVRDRPNAVVLPRVKGAVEFERVTFSYDGRRHALKDFTLKVSPGMTVALVGPTGAGKSTSMALLHRMWDPQSGTIRVDGLDIRDATLESLRRNVGVVFQDNTMFYRTLAENLRIGKQDATDAELVEAAKLAEAHEFIERQSDGYNTQVGERQRISIARALLKNPPILILDEATSALDAVTEAKIQKALKSLMKGRTTFIIAHRLSTIRDADLVVVFDKGEAVEIGGYQELLARNGAFARLVATQQGGALTGTAVRQFMGDPDSPEPDPNAPELPLAQPA
jgi:ABC-type multidrug transport system fused ATPase/permease subunit